MRGFVDVHSHVVPSGDDGAVGVEEGLALCRLAYESGTDVLFATPHAHAPWDTFPRTPERDATYRAMLPVMQREVATWGLDLRRGWEVYPTVVVPEDVEEYSLEGTRGVLIEFPGSWVQLDDAIEIVTEAGRIVERAGLVPVLAHPERCRAVAEDPRLRPTSRRARLAAVRKRAVVPGSDTARSRSARRGRSSTPVRSPSRRRTAIRMRAHRCWTRRTTSCARIAARRLRAVCSPARPSRGPDVRSRVASRSLAALTPRAGSSTARSAGTRRSRCAPRRVTGARL